MLNSQKRKIVFTICRFTTAYKFQRRCNHSNIVMSYFSFLIKILYKHNLRHKHTKHSSFTYVEVQKLSQVVLTPISQGGVK